MQHGRRRAGLLAAFLAASLVAAACGGGSDGGGAGGSTEAEADTSAVLRVPGDADPSVIVGFDPVNQVANAFVDQARLLYDTLLRPADLEGEYEPGLARTATVASPTRIDIELHPGIRFSDGTALDAEAVRFSLQRNIDSKNGRAFRNDLFAISEIEVHDELRLSLHFSQPVAGSFYTRLSRNETLVVSPTAVNAGADFGSSPVGAGPFLLESFEPGQRVRYRKNPDYFQADRIKVAGIDVIAAEAGPAIVNGLLAGQLDAVESQDIAYGQVSGLRANPDLEIDVRPWAGNTQAISMCKSRPPFDDVRVRQALAYAIDRDEVNELVFAGEGEVAWDYFPADHPMHDADLDDRFEHDPDKARQLLRDAGVSSLSFGAFVNPGSDGSKTAEVVQAQLAEVGVDLRIVTTSNVLADFYREAREPAYFVAFPTADAIVRNFTAGQIGNVCNYDDPTLNGFMAATAAVDPSDRDAAKQAWSDVQQEIIGKALQINMVFGPAATVWSDRLGGVELVINATNWPSVDLFKAFVKQP